MNAERRKRPSLKAAVEWIALNDDTADMNPASVGSSVSVLLVADLFGANSYALALRIVEIRRKEFDV